MSSTEAGTELHPKVLLIKVAVIVVLPVAVRAVEGIINVPEPLAIATVSVRPVAVFAPERLYSIVYSPSANELPASTVTNPLSAKQISEAIKSPVASSGIGFTSKVVLVATVLTQAVLSLVIEVTVTVVEPVAVKLAALRTIEASPPVNVVLTVSVKVLASDNS